MQLAYRIDGFINGAEILGEGVARINTTTGNAELEVAFKKRPDAWDPRTIVLMCCSRAPGMPSREDDTDARSLMRLSGGIVSIGKEISGARRTAVILNQGGRALADISASSRTNLASPRSYDHSTVHGSYCSLEPGKNGIAKIVSVRGVMLGAGPHLVTLTTNYELILETGETVYGATYYPHYLPNPKEVLPRPQSFALNVLECTFAENLLYVTTQSTVASIPVGDLTMAGLR